MGLLRAIRGSRLMPPHGPLVLRRWGQDRLVLRIRLPHRDGSRASALRAATLSWAIRLAHPSRAQTDSDGRHGPGSTRMDGVMGLGRLGWAAMGGMGPGRLGGSIVCAEAVSQKRVSGGGGWGVRGRRHCPEGGAHPVQTPLCS